MEEKDLTKMTVANLREEAKKYTSIQGIHAMKKEELIRAIADVRGEPIEIKK
ncbi:MAG: Rho termination factor N-terminal domain-containing protein, partial [Deltaproteobacteria bacterium]|nr:Rho termination factor N-terminal domain-containing protein [Deltaproteobacteria bacterium]